MTEMNLIEQLGGYENAKERLKRDNVLSDDDFNYGQRQLLEYRRQHNIFEVEDWIVVGEHRVLAKFVGYVHKGTHAELPQININGRLYSSYLGAWEHATDEEIEAGKRLESC